VNYSRSKIFFLRSYHFNSNFKVINNEEDEFDCNYDYLQFILDQLLNNEGENISNNSDNNILNSNTYLNFENILDDFMLKEEDEIVWRNNGRERLLSNLLPIVNFALIDPFFSI
jgi:hypothetical protein